MQKMRTQGVWRVLGRTLEELRMMAQEKGKERRPEEWDIPHGAGDRMSRGLCLALGTRVAARRLSLSLCEGAS